MAKSRENIALEWTRAELVETLGSARRTLETYAESLEADAAAHAKPPATDLGSCVDALHQAHGVLVMLELEAAATFAAHLESVALGLTEGSLADPAGAAERLMQGLLELPDYLDAQREGLGDTIVPLLPVLNELRLHLRQPPLAAPHQAPLFASVPEGAVLERFTALDGLVKVRRLRAVYQQMLLSVLKGGIELASIDTLQKVALSMQRLCEGTPTAVLWRAFDEYLYPVRESLGGARGALGSDAIKLLRRLDSELRGVAQGGVEALARPVPPELLQLLVGPTLAAGRSNAFLDELQQALSATDISEALASSGRRALASAAAALRDDLTGVRDRVDLLVRRGGGDAGAPIEFDALLAPLRQISSTMSLLGLESSRALVAAQLDVLTGSTVDAIALAAMAEALEQVDRNLASLSQGGKGDAELVLDAAQQAVLAEARHALELLKQGIVDYVSSHWDVRHLQELPGTLNGVASALRMVPLIDAAALLDRCVAYLTEELLAGHVPDWRELDRYAGAVSGVDYYLERLATPGGAGADEILAYAQRSLSELGVDSAAELRAASHAPAEPAATAVEAPTAIAVEANGATLAEADEEPAAATAEPVAATAESVAATAESAEAVYVSVPGEVAPATDADSAEEAASDVATEAASQESSEVPFEAPSAETTEAVTEDEWSLADEIELAAGAEEPIHAIAAWMPAESNAPADRSAQLEAPAQEDAREPEVLELRDEPATAEAHAAEPIAETAPLVFFAEPETTVETELAPPAEAFDPAETHERVSFEDETPDDASGMPALPDYTSTAAPFWKVPEVSTEAETVTVAAEESAQQEVPEPDAEEILLEEPAPFAMQAEPPLAVVAESIVAEEPERSLDELVGALADESFEEPADDPADASADPLVNELVDAAASAVPPAMAAVPGRLDQHADQFDVDEEILAVFVEEVDEVLASIDAHLPPWQRDLGEGQHAMELRRAFHTLKGSGRLVGANVLGELGWSIEQMLNRAIDGDIDASGELLSVIAAARDVTPDLRDAFAARVPGDRFAVARVIERAEAVSAGVGAEEAYEPVIREAESTAAEIVVEEAPDALAAPVTDIVRLDRELDTELAIGDPDPLSIFCEEAEEHLATVASARQVDGYRLDESVTRAFHTLAGSAAMVGVPVVADLARATLEVLQAVLESRGTVLADGVVTMLLESVAVALEADVRALRVGAPLLPHAELIADAEQLRSEAPVAPLVTALLALPGLDALLGAQEYLDDWRARDFDTDRAWTLNTVLRELLDLSRAPEHMAVTELVTALRDAHDRLARTRLGESTARALLAGHERLLGQIDALVAGQPLRAADEAVAALRALEPEPEVSAAPGAVAEPAFEVDGPAEATSFEADFEVDESLSAAAIAAAPEAVQAAAPAVSVETVDPELVAIFLEEAEELLEQMDHAVRACAEQADPQTAIEGLLRALHTFKGGARLAGLATAGDAAHDFESWLIGHRDVGAALDATAAAELHARYDGLAALVANAGRAPQPPAAVEPAEPAEETWLSIAAQAGPASALSAALTEQAQPAVHEPVVAEAVPTLVEVAPPTSWFATVQPAQGAAVETGAKARGQTQGDQRNAEEVVRVRASLLEQLVGLAGEASIIRGRVQQGLAEFGGALDEMEITIQRVREQLRRLEIETETQILFRRERPDSPTNEDFDPLELDRYSQVQQLSRSLSESASDMLDLKETLRLRAGETDALLVQQGRINTQLQEGLMRSRMVPFARLVPRLRRTVRQVAQDLRKPVDLVAYNVEGELDRSLLDRMMAPLEHMLRNAVDHGIESADVRRALGKPDKGRIELRLSREGGDVVIEISDDGAGIDVARVKAKAEEQGLLALNAELSDDEIRQFIFAPGFSTARSVTQISGRGVGMDVAYSEVKQLGGSIGLASEPGRGTRFLVRVPFTVSVNRALMVSVGEDLYAVPLNTIEGIVLVRGDELAALAASDGGVFEYAGLGYRVRHLGEYLGRRARAGSTSGSVPVVLVRSGDSAVAVQVDGVQGSREIVVKGLGPQFAGVAGISGATILGDGGVVVILDLPALVRGRLEGGLAERKRGASLARARAVLVVDDSVTVRKVTSRLLERNGMEAILAKDGVEAIASLQERRPDVMLLDIEMPRMDGFEVLRHVRHDRRLADIPVIMISSRTGAKHQDRAAELGVNHFLGKPFQEAELLTVIEQLLE